LANCPDFIGLLDVFLRQYERGSQTNNHLYLLKLINSRALLVKFHRSGRSYLLNQNEPNNLKAALDFNFQENAAMYRKLDQF
jgi:hypothetical protein